MTQAISEYIVGLFSGAIPKELIVFIISMFPVLELRGGMIAASLLEVDLLKAFVICYFGNIVPIPFILLFIRRIFRFLKRFKTTRGLIEKLEVRSMRKKDSVLRWRNWGLLAFVALPLPGTGGWTGSLIAALLDIRIRNSFPIIALGILIADLIMSIFSYGLLGLIF